MKSSVSRFWRDERGATAIEYGLIVSLIFLVIVTAMTVFGNKSTNMYNMIATSIGNAVGP